MPIYSCRTPAIWRNTDWLQGSGLAFNYPFGKDDWAYHILQPVVEPQYQRRDFIDVMWELVDRIGKWDEFTEVLNKTYDLADEYKIKPGERITRLDLCDRMVKSLVRSRTRLGMVQEARVYHVAEEGGRGLLEMVHRLQGADLSGAFDRHRRKNKRGHGRSSASMSIPASIPPLSHGRPARSIKRMRRMTSTASPTATSCIRARIRWSSRGWTR